MIKTTAYEATDFEYLLGTPGFSDKMLLDHFKLYQGYVKNTNALMEAFDEVKDADDFKGPEMAELRRRFGWEFNGMRLHEYYFGNMSKTPVQHDPKSPLAQKIASEFGSFDKWKNEFIHTGQMRGIGWMALSYDKLSDRLLSSWVNEHDTGLPAGTEPLLIMDVFEHAFMRDYGLERKKYIASFWDAIAWTEVERRFDENKSEK